LARGEAVFAGIEISIEPRKVTAADFKAQPVALAGNVACGPQIKGELVGLTGVHELRLLPGIAVARADDSFGQVLCETVWPYVHEFCGKVGIHGRGTGEEVLR